MTSQHDRDSRELRELCAQRDAARATVRQQAERIAELEKEALAKPFAPDWAGYRQGLEDGKREGQAERDRLLAEVERLRAGLLETARMVEDLKKPVSMDNPESPQAVRNSLYMSISYFARAIESAKDQK